MGEPAIRVEGLSKQYRVTHGVERSRYRTLRETLVDAVKAPFHKRATTEEFWALKDVSFEVQPGEVVGIIGRNGAGKSTLLKILSRITKPTTGRVELNGRVGSLLEVGTGFHPELTGRENVYLNGSILGMSRAEVKKKFDEIVAFAEVEKFLDTPVKRYSSGMYVRLAFAVAAHLEPEILIVDEVLAVGDQTFQRRCIGKMGEVAHAGRTVLVVSHNMAVVRGLCTKAVTLSQGRVVDAGTTSSVVDRYLKTGMAEKANSADLTATQRTLGGDRFRLTAFAFNESEPIQHGERLAVRFEYQVTGFCPDVSVGFGFSTLEGVRVLTIESDSVSDRRPDFHPGDAGKICLIVNNLPLQPGLYQLDLGARSGDHNALDYLPGCCLIEVMPGPRTPGIFLRSELSGSVRVPPTAVSWLPNHEPRAE